MKILLVWWAIGLARTVYEARLYGVGQHPYAGAIDLARERFGDFFFILVAGLFSFLAGPLPVIVGLGLVCRQWVGFRILRWRLTHGRLRFDEATSAVARRIDDPRCAGCNGPRVCSQCRKPATTHVCFEYAYGMKFCLDFCPGCWPR